MAADGCNAEWYRSSRVCGESYHSRGARLDFGHDFGDVYHILPIGTQDGVPKPCGAAAAIPTRLFSGIFLGEGTQDVVAAVDVMYFTRYTRRETREKIDRGLRDFVLRHVAP